LPTLADELNAFYTDFRGNRFRRLASAAFDLQDPAQMNAFLKGEAREITVPGSGKKFVYDGLRRVGVGLARLGTTETVSIGAYAFALGKLDSM
jgi:glucokinase